MEKNEIKRFAALAKQGDRHAFEQLYDEYKGRLYAFIYKNINDKQTAEDILSETFVTMLEQISSLKNDEAFGAWGYRIAYSKCMDYLKDNARTGHLEDDSEQTLSDENAALNEPIMLPDEYAESRELRDRIRAVIEELDPKQRSAVILYYYEEMSVAEAAKTLGIKEGAVRARLFKARKKIKSGIEKYAAGGTLCAVPFGALLDESITKAYASASIKGAAVSTFTGLKVAAASAALAVAVGVPAGLHYLSKGDSFGELDDSSIGEHNYQVLDAHELDLEKLIYFAEISPSALDTEGVYRYLLIDSEGDAYSASFLSEYKGQFRDSFVTLLDERDNKALEYLDYVTYLGPMEFDERERISELIAKADPSAGYEEVQAQNEPDNSFMCYTYKCFPARADKGMLIMQTYDGKYVTGQTTDSAALELNEMIRSSSIYRTWNNSDKSAVDIDRIVFSLCRSRVDRRCMFVTDEGNVYFDDSFDLAYLLNGYSSDLSYASGLMHVCSLADDETARLNELLAGVDINADVYRNNDDDVDDTKSLYTCYPLIDGKRKAMEIEYSGNLVDVLRQTRDKNALEIKELILDSNAYREWLGFPMRAEDDTKTAEYSVPSADNATIGFTFKGQEYDVYKQAVLETIAEPLADEGITMTSMNTVFSADDMDKGGQNGLCVRISFEIPVEMTVGGNKREVSGIVLIGSDTGESAKISVNGGSVMSFGSRPTAALLGLIGVSAPITEGFEVVSFDKDSGHFLAVCDSFGLCGFTLSPELLEGIDTESITSGDIIYIRWPGEVAESYPGLISGVTYAELYKGKRDFVSEYMPMVLMGAGNEPTAEIMQDSVNMIDDLSKREREGLLWLVLNELGL